jgi:outer membrane lipoprotein
MRSADLTSLATTLAALFAGAVLLAACTTIPEGLQPVPEGQPGLVEVLQDPDAFEGVDVLWGGVIANVSNLAEGTRLEIVSRPLGRDQRPIGVDRSDGRFHAFFPGFLDPQVHARLREVTVRGRVAGVTDGVIGAFPYTFPQVEADSVHLWPPVQPEPHVIYRDPFWDPWGPWGPYRHPWRRGWW